MKWLAPGYVFEPKIVSNFPKRECLYLFWSGKILFSVLTIDTEYSLAIVAFNHSLDWQPGQRIEFKKTVVDVEFQIGTITIFKSSIWYHIFNKIGFWKVLVMIFVSLVYPPCTIYKTQAITLGFRLGFTLKNQVHFTS